MDENKRPEEDRENESLVEEAVSDRKDIPKWKKFFFIYPSISRSSYVLRALAGAYVAYLGGTNLVSLTKIESGDFIMVGALSLFLFLCGAHLAFSGAYALVKQEYS